MRSAMVVVSFPGAHTFGTETTCTMAEGKAKVVVGGPPKKGEGSMNQERILAQFEKMRQEQRAIASKIAELEGDMNEHRFAFYLIRTIFARARSEVCILLPSYILYTMSPAMYIL